jgi:cytochrome aa3-600 menaquinol oxidase subunit IV
MSHRAFPLSHLFGFLLSLVMTFAAAWAALNSGWSGTTILWVIGTLACLQAGMQLFLFMHVSEGEDRHTQVINIAYMVFTAIVIVAGTIWVMAFGNHMH